MSRSAGTGLEMAPVHLYCACVKWNVYEQMTARGGNERRVAKRGWQLDMESRWVISLDGKLTCLIVCSTQSSPGAEAHITLLSPPWPGFQSSPRAFKSMIHDCSKFPCLNVYPNNLSHPKCFSILENQVERMVILLEQAGGKIWGGRRWERWRGLGGSECETWQTGNRGWRGRPLCKLERFRAFQDVV